MRVVFLLFLLLKNPFALMEKLYGVPAKEIKRICMRESKCALSYGVHKDDIWAAKRMYNKGIEKGWIDLSCSNYRIVNDNEYARWGVRGPFGLSAAYHLRYLQHTPCPEPELLDNFYYSLYIVVQVMRETPDCVSRVRRWVGEGNWQKRDFEGKKDAVRKQCGKKVADNLAEN